MLILIKQRGYYGKYAFSSDFADRHGRVVNIPASYSGGLELKSRPGYRLSWLTFFVVFSVHVGELRDSSLKLVHDSFLPNSFQFIVHLSLFHSTVYSRSYGKKRR
jgi:hypothetical protein